jgi:hypothetical protein
VVANVDAALAEPQRSTRYAYDAHGRLTEVRDGANALVASYTDDPFDRRLSKRLGDGTVTYYLHSPTGLADAAGQVTSSYGWSPERSNGTHPVYARIPDPANGATARRFVYYHNDQLGTPWRITDRAGNLVWRADYDAFGKAMVQTTAPHGVTSNLRLPGQYFDAESGLHDTTGATTSPRPGATSRAIRWGSRAARTSTPTRDTTRSTLATRPARSSRRWRCGTARVPDLLPSPNSTPPSATPTNWAARSRRCCRLQVTNAERAPAAPRRARRSARPRHRA